MNLEVVSIATVLEAIVKCEIFSKKAETLKRRKARMHLLRCL